MPRKRKPTGEDVARAALRMVGTPYHLRGRVPGAGLDCLGVVVCAHRDVGIAIEETPDYRAAARMEYAALKLLRREFVRVRRDPESGTTPVFPGDVVCWRLGQAHLGVVVEDAAGELAVAEADDSYTFRTVAVVPLGVADRVYRHRSLA